MAGKQKQRSASKRKRAAACDESPGQGHKGKPSRTRAKKRAQASNDKVPQPRAVPSRANMDSNKTRNLTGDEATRADDQDVQSINDRPSTVGLLVKHWSDSDSPPPFRKPVAPRKGPAGARSIRVPTSSLDGAGQTTSGVASPARSDGSSSSVSTNLFSGDEDPRGDGGAARQQHVPEEHRQPTESHESPLNAQQQVNHARKLKPIKNWSSNFEAPEAVLDSYYANEVHTAPYGTNGERLERSVEYLKSVWGLTANPRTMKKYVDEMLDAHGPEENALDAETGREYDRTLIEERIREKLNLMVEERRDFVEMAEATTEKRKREEMLRQAGLRHRENVARSVIGDRITELGGRQQRLSSDGVIEDVPGEEADNDQGGRTQRQRRTPRHQQRIENMLEEDLSSRTDLESPQLALEEKRFAADVELSMRVLSCNVKT
ncbi:hypothetical protein PHYSODRAFT_302629 [Phytophthora sojae]|uniref:Uncharacterized protein n=1 Tax=Phytophthora sojae (strain P6497) TaxID=1094619 RepID=G4ZPX6_PHYSP|nr:hypothetical protein PHYSODRAFT_302629 [Phytophthora sojae]EGZ16380.1 hypothetical protein PHYSODRAFT_302629 [Phytophthora sojae]|eukprot:XP_009530129.1 hypothetical protein PHYSODRAFT_302629 [Phytophthora sojae]